jgi:hypothetical protein
MEETVRRVLEAARAEGGDPPDAAFVRTARVLRRALQAADDLSPASQRALEDDHPSTPSVERYHEVLVCLVHSGPEPLLEGQGNFGGVCAGHPDGPPAHPRYTECRITPRGLQYLIDTAPRRNRRSRRSG